MTKCTCGERGEREIIHPVLAAWQQLKAKPDPVPSASPTLGDADPQGMPLPHTPAVPGWVRADGSWRPWDALLSHGPPHEINHTSSRVDLSFNHTPNG